MVTLSSSEAEYVAISEMCKEIIFVWNILKFLDIHISLPIIIMCDNVGEIFLSNNNENKRLKHIDVRVHFVREYVVNGIIMIKFVKSEENKADPFKKM